MFVPFRIEAIGVDPAGQIGLMISYDEVNPPPEGALERACVFVLGQLQAAMKAADKAAASLEDRKLRYAHAVSDCLQPIEDAGGIEVPDAVH